MTPETNKDEPDRQVPAGHAPKAPLSDQRRLYRPEEPGEDKRAVFSDWASI